MQYFMMICYIYCVATYEINMQFGPRFDGIGAVSGGGATSKLLLSYPTQYLDQLFDLLFKPSFGASLHLLKVEIGGDVQSTEGTESSHQHSESDLNYRRGYEWHIMNAAVQRNPNILLYGLPWGFPGWLGATPFENIDRTSKYVTNWVKGAKHVYNLTINYVGIWNEKLLTDLNYITSLRQALNLNGFVSTKIVAADKKWGIINQLLQNNYTREIARFVDIIGCHYPGTYSVPEAARLGKPLWSSEDYSTYGDNVGAGCMARILNQNFVNGNMTSTIIWNLISAYYDHLPYPRNGLITANEPWSGYYHVDTPLWIVAHTTQFTKIGWSYIPKGNGSGRLDHGGSYVSFTDGNNLTMVIETMSHNHSICIRPYLKPFTVKAQNVTFKLASKFQSLKQLYVRKTRLKFGSNSAQSIIFAKHQPINISSGMIYLQLGIDEIWTLSSLGPGVKGEFVKPSFRKPFPIPYSDDFDDYNEFAEPNYFVPQAGSFEVVKYDRSRKGKVLVQTVHRAPINWCPYKEHHPIIIGGDYNWFDTLVYIDFLVPQPENSTEQAGVFVASRVENGGCLIWTSPGLFLSLKIGLSSCEYCVSMNALRYPVLISGSCWAKFGKWYRLGLLTNGFTVSGLLDGKLLFTYKSGVLSSRRGFVGFGTETFGLAYFDNLNISRPT